MQRLRRWSPRPAIRTRLVAALLTVLALVPPLLRLPRVVVVACFDAAHPLYQWVPTSDLATGVHCVSAPAPVVGWTLMIGATLIVQLALLPALLLVGAMLLRAVRALATIADRFLTAALVQPGSVLVPNRQPVTVPIRTRFAGVTRTRENPLRGPPTCL